MPAHLPRTHFARRLVYINGVQNRLPKWSRGGKKTIARRILSDLGRMPAHLLDPLKAEVQARLRELEDLDHGSNMSPEQLAIFMPALRPIYHVNIISEVLGIFPPLKEFLDEIEAHHETYQPGGPPMSPVHDSLFMMWSVLDLRSKRTRETLAEVCAELAPKLGLDAKLITAIKVASEARLGLYRVQAAQSAIVGDSPRYLLRELVTRNKIVVQCLEDHDVREGDLLLLRLFELPAAEARKRQCSHVIVTTPYVLEDFTDPLWTDYFEREAGNRKRRLDNEAYVDIMRGVGDPLRWLEYVFVGYVGQRRLNLVRVTGIPDRPETLPHHEDYDPELEFQIPPRTPTRERASILSRKLISLAQQQADGDLAARIPEELREDPRLGGWLAVAVAVVMYEDMGDGRTPLLAEHADEHPVDEDAKEYLEANLVEGFTSIFEVVEVSPGEQLKLRNLLDDKVYTIIERSGSEAGFLRTIFFARIVKYRDVWLMECSYPHPASPQLREKLQEAMPEASPRTQGRGFYGESSIAAMLAWQRVIDATKPESPQHMDPRKSADEVALVFASYVFRPDRRPELIAAIHRLRHCHAFEDDRAKGASCYAVTTAERTLEARLFVTDCELAVESNAQESMDRVVQRIRGKVPGVLRLADRDHLTYGDMRQRAQPKVQEPMPPEVQAQMLELLREHYSTFLDEAVPGLAGLTPREAARDKSQHKRLDELLRSHEAKVAEMFGTEVIDFKAMREELELPFR